MAAVCRADGAWPETEVRVTAEPHPANGCPVEPSGISPLAVAGLRLSTSTDFADIAGMVLDAIVPSFAAAAAVFVPEQLMQGEPDGHRDVDRLAVRRLGARIGGERVSQGAFPPGDVIVLSPASPYARCMRAREPVLFGRPDSRTLEQSRPGARAAFARYASFLAVPMSTGSMAAGFLAVARPPGAPAFAKAEVAAAERLADCAGTGIGNAVTLARNQAIASTLQHGLLAAEPPRPALLEMAAQCQPAAGNLVGGDWYDIIPLPGERTGLVVGDVMGHGLEAAAVMAQLRAAAHALAQLDLSPAELIRHLNQTSAMIRGLALATCVYAVIDPAGGSCTLAAAGHLPPVLAQPDGTTRTLILPSGQSLGLGPASYGEARIKLAPGATLALYTDGLVETRTRSFDQGIGILRTHLARVDDSLDITCEALIRALAGHSRDDVTLILARIPGGS
jgi:hypothetical protein